MPWKIFKEDNKFCVYKHDEQGAKVGEAKGCHDDRAGAVAQLRALYVNVPEASKEAGCPDCGGPLVDNQQCPSCGLLLEAKDYRTDLKPGDFLVVEDPEKSSTWHLPITKSAGGEPDRGLCGAAWAALFSPNGFRGNKYDGPKKGEAQKRLKSIYSRMGWPEPATKELHELGLSEAGIKAFEHDGVKYLWLWTTNGFKDRDGETFRTKALEDWVTRHDSTGNYGRVWFWHVKGSDFADIIWSDVSGRILLELARVDATPYGEKMYHALTHPAEYSDIAPDGWGTSHGYLYPASALSGGVYDFMEKFESTVLPLHVASNLVGKVGGFVMGVTKQKRDALARIVGDDEADTRLQEAKEASSVLEQAGISFKELEQGDKGKMPPALADNAKKKPCPPGQKCDEEPEGEAEPEEETKEAADDEADEVMELELDDNLVQQIADKVDVKSAVKEATTGLKEALVEAFKAELPTMIKDAVDARLKELVGTREQAVKEVLTSGGRLTLRPYVASKDSGNVVDSGTVEAQKAAKTDAKRQDVVANVVQNMINGRIG